ncbi:uncharacterized protein LOC111688720 [Lucilia cuprina]|uniref:uncharacterized protein LOC111688720 n=1 Tax=Lucilia cuprina TaxID=7375 RepID=UPI001F05F913|nr:uncharacterized protein LOC111688720 [Lucilia cuprina]
MKTLSANILCCSCKLYKLGLLIAFLYLIPNLIIIVCFFANDYDVYTLPFMCALVVLTSLLLIKGLMEDRHEFLLPWLANIAVLILFNIIFVACQFGELNREGTKESFYLEFGLFIALELQILCWYIIYNLLIRGIQKHKRQAGAIRALSEIVEAQDKDYYKVNLIANEHLGVEKKVISV